MRQALRGAIANINQLNTVELRFVWQSNVAD